MRFDIPVQALGELERRFFAGGAIILGQAVDGESDGVELFLAVEGLAGRIQAPIDTPLNGVIEAVPDLGIGAVGDGPPGRVAEDAGGCGEGP